MDIKSTKPQKLKMNFHGRSAIHKRARYSHVNIASRDTSIFLSTAKLPRYLELLEQPQDSPLRTLAKTLTSWVTPIIAM